MRASDERYFPHVTPPSSRWHHRTQNNCADEAASKCVFENFLRIVFFFAEMKRSDGVFPQSLPAASVTVIFDRTALAYGVSSRNVVKSLLTTSSRIFNAEYYDYGYGGNTNARHVQDGNAWEAYFWSFACDMSSRGQHMFQSHFLPNTLGILVSSRVDFLSSPRSICGSRCSLCGYTTLYRSARVKLAHAKFFFHFLTEPWSLRERYDRVTQWCANDCMIMHEGSSAWVLLHPPCIELFRRKFVGLFDTQSCIVSHAPSKTWL